MNLRTVSLSFAVAVSSVYCLVPITLWPELRQVTMRSERVWCPPVGSQRQDTQPALAIPDLPAPSRTQADGPLDCSSFSLHLLRCLIQNRLRVF